MKNKNKPALTTLQNQKNIETFCKPGL